MALHQSATRFQDREKLVQGYSQFVRENLDEGRNAFFLNFMFNQLPGAVKTRMGIMTQEVERVHSILVLHIVRRPNVRKWSYFRPIFLGSHDLPVFK